MKWVRYSERLTTKHEVLNSIFMETIVKDGVEYKLVPLHKKQEANNYALFVLTMDALNIKKEEE